MRTHIYSSMLVWGHIDSSMLAWGHICSTSELARVSWALLSHPWGSWRPPDPFRILVLQLLQALLQLLRACFELYYCILLLQLCCSCCMLCCSSVAAVACSVATGACLRWALLSHPWGSWQPHKSIRQHSSSIRHHTTVLMSHRWGSWLTGSLIELLVA